jgi:hypothetical protein
MRLRNVYNSRPSQQINTTVMNRNEEILDKDDDYNGQLVVMIYYITVVVCKIHEQLRV